MAGLGIDKRTEKGRTVVAVSGEVDIATAPSLRSHVDEVIASDDAPAIVLDLSRVTFLDSSGLGVLVAALTRVREKGGSLSLVVTNRPVRHVLELTDLDKVFDVFGSLDEALT